MVEMIRRRGISEREGRMLQVPSGRSICCHTKSRDVAEPASFLWREPDDVAAMPIQTAPPDHTDPGDHRSVQDADGFFPRNRITRKAVPPQTRRSAAAEGSGTVRVPSGSNVISIDVVLESGLIVFRLNLSS